MLKIKQFVFGPFGVNTYIIYDDDSHEAIIVDPGMNTAAERNMLDSFIVDNSLHIRQVVNTHLHIDHCLGDNYVSDKYSVHIAAQCDEAFLGAAVEAQAQMFGINALDPRPVTINVCLNDGDTIEIGKHKLRVLHVPGHSPGGLSFYSPGQDFVLSGDSLFHHSIGRTDLPGGNHHSLIDAVKCKLLSLPDNTLVLPGHDMHTTIADEKQKNPFLH